MILNILELLSPTMSCDDVTECDLFLNIVLLDRYCYIILTTYAFQGQAPADEDENTPQKRVDKIFSQMDKNHDEKLTLDEFKEGSKNDPRIIQALSLGDN